MKFKALPTAIAKPSRTVAPKSKTTTSFTTASAVVRKKKTTTTTEEEETAMVYTGNIEEDSFDDMFADDSIPQEIDDEIEMSPPPKPQSSSRKPKAKANKASGSSSADPHAKFLEELKAARLQVRLRFRHLRLFS